MTPHCQVGGNIIVFLGPSLPLSRARAVLPGALYLPPAQCGDVLRVLRLEPKVIVIIDGLYERVASVWHKEVLLALSRGVKVVGGGSMGALRAAELAHLGMVGVGKTFREFRDGVLTDDDEVAVVHTLEGEPLTDAMVNLRDTAERAVRRGVLDAVAAESVLRHAKATFYPERTLEEAVRRAVKDGAAPERMERFLAWSRGGGYRDRKWADALATLRLAARIAVQPRPAGPPPAAPLTGFLRALLREANCSAFCGFHPQLPPAETTALAARFLGTSYEETKRLARLLGTVHDIAVARRAERRCDARQDRGLLPPGFGSPMWLSGNDATEAAARSFARRMKRIAALEGQVDQREGAGGALPPVDEFLKDLMRIDGIYVEHRRVGLSVATELRRRDPSRYRRLLLTARLWRVFEGEGRRIGLEPRRDLLQEFADDFRRERRTEGPQLMQEWLRSSDLTPAGLIRILQAWYRYEMLAGNHNLGILGVEPADDQVWWLRDALWLTGLYREAKGLSRPGRRALREAVVPPADDEQAFRRDFTFGQLSLDAEYRRLEELTHYGPAPESDRTALAEGRNAS